MRQQERRRLFRTAFATMPLWETWTTTDYNVPSATIATNMYQAGYEAVTTKIAVELPRIQRHVRGIPRRVRRDMARQLARRQWHTRIRTQSLN